MAAADSYRRPPPFRPMAASPSGPRHPASGVIPAASRPPSERSPVSTRSPNAPRALLLEDDGAMLRTFERLLSQRGVMVMAASTPGEALYYVSAIDGPVRPTVAFLDVLVPALDGPRFVQALRQNPHFATAPIVLVSGLSAPILEKTAEEWGVNGFILKSKGLLHLDTAFEGWLQRVGVPPAPRSGAGSSAPPGSGGSSGGSSAPPSTGNNTPGSSRAIR